MDQTPVASSLLEERVAMYLQAIEYATAANDNARRHLLERDIQTLMDLMERASVGQVVTADSVPPPLHIHSQHAGEALANPLGELSARLANYHKALYYADIEIGDNRQRIQTLQQGLQVIQKLQGNAQNGIPVRAEEIPPPVDIPTDDEFVKDSKSVLTERIAMYYQAIENTQDRAGDTRAKSLHASLQELEYLLKRAEANIPIYHKDLPAPPALGDQFRQMTEHYRLTVETLTKMSGLSLRAARLAAARGDAKMEGQLQYNAKMLTNVLEDYKQGKPLDMSSCPYTLADIERLADQAGVPGSQHLQDSETIRLRCNQYKLEALRAKRAGQTDVALQHMRVVKGLQSMTQAVEKGEKVDMTQVPPPPSEQTLTTAEAAFTMTQQTTLDSQQDIDSQGEGSHPGSMSLAKELSAYLDESPPPGDSSESSSETSSESSSSPEKYPPVKTPPTAPAETALQGKGHRTALTSEPLSSSSSSGLNPLYALTQNSSNMSEHSAPLLSPNKGHNSTSAVPQSPGVPSLPAPSIPSRALKPGSAKNDAPRTEVLLPKSVNGFYGNNRVPEPQSQPQSVWEEEVEKKKAEVSQNVSRLNRLNNGTHLQSPELTCIEILKYEKMLLDKEGSAAARLVAERLNGQMEEEKQRLRHGGYEAWLAYLGEVEEDVTNINCEMKRARESGEDETLASLIVKKELAERELAVMRKRLPELQN